MGSVGSRTRAHGQDVGLHVVVVCLLNEILLGRVAGVRQNGFIVGISGDANGRIDEHLQVAQTFEEALVSSGLLVFSLLAFVVLVDLASGITSQHGSCSYRRELHKLRPARAEK